MKLPVHRWVFNTSLLTLLIVTFSGWSLLAETLDSKFWIAVIISIHVLLINSFLVRAEDVNRRS